MITSADFIPVVNSINEAFADFEEYARSFIFLEWNPLFNESDTLESKFWRECINIHILFRECMPGALSGEDYSLKKAFFTALGYQDAEIHELNSFCFLLRELRLYRCHLLDGNIQRTVARRQNIEKNFRDMALTDEWQFRMDEEQWELTFRQLYDTAASLLYQMAKKIKAVRDEQRAQVFAAWKTLYVRWYASSEMCRTYLHSGFCEYYIMEDRISDVPSQEKPARRADKAMRNDALKERAKAEYANMTAYKTFEPAQLSFEIVKAVMRN